MSKYNFNHDEKFKTLSTKKQAAVVLTILGVLLVLLLFAIALEFVIMPFVVVFIASLFGVHMTFIQGFCIWFGIDIGRTIINRVFRKEKHEKEKEKLHQFLDNMMEKIIKYSIDEVKGDE